MKPKKSPVGSGQRPTLPNFLHLSGPPSAAGGTRKEACLGTEHAAVEESRQTPRNVCGTHRTHHVKVCQGRTLFRLGDVKPKEGRINFHEKFR